MLLRGFAVSMPKSTDIGLRKKLINHGDCFLRKPIRLETILPFALAILLPALRYLDPTGQSGDMGLLQTAQAWAVASFLLLVIWFSNDWLRNKVRTGYYPIAIGLNLLLIAIILATTSITMPDESNLSASFLVWTGFRLALAVAIVFIVQQSIRSARQLEQLQVENLELRTAQYKAELEELRQQINPHFLFNSLSTLRTMVRTSNPNSEQFVMHLASMYRRILQSHERDSASVAEELKFLEAYIYLLKVRFEHALQVSINVDPQALQHSLPVFSLHLLMENCVKHNVATVDSPLRVSVFQKDEVTITVSNNYKPRTSPIDSPGVGLTNLSHRYQLLGVKDGLSVTKTDQEFAVTLKML